MRTRRGQRIALLLALGLAACLVVGLGARRIWTVDYWWQWATGEYVAEHGIPHTAIHSATNPGHDRIELRWAYCLGLYLTGRTFGHGAAVILKCAALLGAFLLAWVAGGLGPRPFAAAAVVVCAALAASQRFFVRPEVLSYLWFAAFLAIVAVLRRRPSRWCWALPPIQVAWVNTHSFFPLGPMLLACWLFAEVAGVPLDRRLHGREDPDRRRRARVAASLLAATLAASLVNPYLHRALLLPIEQFRALHGTAMKGFYSELVSPFALPGSYTALFYYELLIGLVVVVGLLAARRLSGFWALLVAAMFYLSVVSVRNLPLFCLAAIPFVLVHLPRAAFAGRLERRARPLRALGPALLALFVLFQLHGLVTDRFNVRQGDSNQFGVGLARQRYPEAATRFLERSGVRGPLFNSSESGSYLMAHGFEVFIDPRGEVYRDRWIDEYRRIVEDAGETERAIERFDLRVFFLEPEMAPLAARLAARADWRIVYADAVSTILMRRDTAPHLPALELSDESWWRDVRERLPATVPYDEIPWYRRVVSPRPYTRLARFCFTMQAYDRAVVLFEDARRAYPAGFADLEPLALAAERSGRYESAADYYAEALLAAPQGSELGKRLALSRLRSGDAPGAIRALDDYLAAHAEDAEGLALRGNVELSAGRPAQAVAWLERAIAAAPQEWLYRHFLGRLLLELERWEEARSALEAAARLAPRQLDPVLDLIALSLRQGEAQRAREWLRRAQAIAPDDPRVRAAAAAVRGVS